MELRYCTGTVTYTRKAVVSPKAAAGRGDGEAADVQLSVCDKDNCFPPKTVPVEATLKVLDGPAVEVEKAYADEVKKALARSDVSAGSSARPSYTPSYAGADRHVAPFAHRPYKAHGCVIRGLSALGAPMPRSFALRRAACRPRLAPRRRRLAQAAGRSSRTSPTVTRRDRPREGQARRDGHRTSSPSTPKPGAWTYPVKSGHGSRLASRRLERPAARRPHLRHRADRPAGRLGERSPTRSTRCKLVTHSKGPVTWELKAVVSPKATPGKKTVVLDKNDTTLQACNKLGCVSSASTAATCRPRTSRCWPATRCRSRRSSRPRSRRHSTPTVRRRAARNGASDGDAGPARSRPSARARQAARRPKPTEQVEAELNDGPRRASTRPTCPTPTHEPGRRRVRRSPPPSGG